MGFEDLKKTKKEDEPKDPERRKFLKNSILGSAGLAVSMSPLGKLDKAFGEEKRNKVKTKEPKTEKFIKMSEQREFNAEEMAEEILRVFNSPAISRRFDREVFTEDFFMAQQFQESRGDHQAESSSGAKGVYQNKPQSVVDVIKYLSFLKRNYQDSSGEKHLDYSGPNNISLKEAESVTNLFLNKADYGRAAGKLYLLSIHDKDSAYNKNPNRDVFRSESPKKQQELLLLAYHDGPSRRLNPEGASKEAKKYVSLVKEYMNTITNIRIRLNQVGISGNINYAIFKILQELDRKENRENPEEVISYWITELRKAHVEKWEQGKNIKKSLNSEEIRRIFA